MIKMISGVYGYRDTDGTIKPKTSKDPPFSLPDEEERRLVRLRVAEYSNTPGEDTPGSGAATPGGGVEVTGEGDTPTGGDGGAEGLESVLEKPAYSANTSFDDLKELLSLCGIKFKVGMSKAGMIAALDEYYGGEDEAPPDLSPEEPEP